MILQILISSTHGTKLELNHNSNEPISSASNYILDYQVLKMLQYIENHASA